MDEALTRLRAADRALRNGDRERGRRIVEDVIHELETLAGDGTRGTKPTA